MVVTFLVVSSGLAALAGLPGPDPSRRQELAAVYSPWTSGREAMARSLAAGFRVLRGGALPFVVIVAREEDAVRPPGALLMLRLDGLAGCLAGERAS